MLAFISRHSLYSNTQTGKEKIHSDCSRQSCFLLGSRLDFQAQRMRGPQIDVQLWRAHIIYTPPPSSPIVVTTSSPWRRVASCPSRIMGLHKIYLLVHIKQVAVTEQKMPAMKLIDVQLYARCVFVPKLSLPSITPHWWGEDAIA